jgi:Uma2 family endonuclease
MQTPPVHEREVRRFRVEEYYRMAEAGVFAKGERVELLEGEVHAMTPQNARHMRVIDRLTMLLAPALSGQGLTVRVQGPITLSEESEPEPDLAVLRTQDVDAATGNRHPSFALLVIEVAESSLSKDRGLKARLYARARIPEYWVVNLKQQTVEVFTGPEPEPGRYAEVRTYPRGQVLRCTSLPRVEVDVEALLG